MGPFLLTDEFSRLYIAKSRPISQFLDLFDASGALHPNHHPFSDATLVALRFLCSVTDAIPTPRISVTAYGPKTPGSVGKKICGNPHGFTLKEIGCAGSKEASA
jgi:hypothetical protein